MRKFISFFLALVLILNLGIIALATETYTISLRSEQSSVQKSEYVYVTVSGNQEIETTYTQAYIKYDPDYLEFDASESTKGTANDKFTAKIGSQNGHNYVIVGFLATDDPTTLTADDWYTLAFKTKQAVSSTEVSILRNTIYNNATPPTKLTTDASSTVTFTITEPDKLPFCDVRESDWYYDAVEYVYENGLMYGTGSNMFSPNSDTTRAMVVAILYRQSGSPDVNSDGKYWWSDARVWAMENGISDGTNMEANITREQMAAMLYRYAKLMDADVSARGNLDKFSDREQISGWAVESVQWAVGEKIIAGRTNGTLDPQGLATRAEVAAMLMRFNKKLG